MLKSKNLKRMLSIMMALVFCLFAATQTLIAAVPEYALDGTIDSALTIMSGAVELEDADTEGNIEIQLQTGGDGAIFTAYKLLNIERDPGTGMLGVSIPTNAQAFWNEYTGKTGTGDDATVSDIKTTIDSKTTKAEKSSSIVDAFVGFSGTMPDSTPSAPAVDGKTVITTKFGFYAILQTGAPVNGYIASAPVLACLPMQNTDKTKWLKSFTIEPKDDTISVTKKVKATGDTDFVDETITNINDTVKYEIVAELPEYGADIISSGITYTLEDILPDGVTMDDSTLKIELWNKTTGAYEVDTALAAHTYTPAATPTKAKLNVSFNNYANDINKKYDKIRITYNADLNKDAVIEGEGNVNNVTLKYSAYKGEAAPAEATADAKVYTMGLDISKIDKNSKAALSGAEFEVYTTSDGSGEAIKFIDITEGGDINKYRVATQKEINDGITTTTIIRVTDNGANKGKLMLDGLNDTKYYLKETTAPIGYNLPKKTFEIDVKPTAFTNETNRGDYNTTNTELDFDSNRLAKEIENATGMDLPVTGGIGTVLFTVIGLLLMAGAAYFLFFSRKKSN